MARLAGVGQIRIALEMHSRSTTSVVHHGAVACDLAVEIQRSDTPRTVTRDATLGNGELGIDLTD